MAANMKSVKLRMKSVQSTMQITKAMELVASSKLRKAKERADICRPYFRELYRTLQNIASENTEFFSVYAKKAVSDRYCYIVLAGDRGLAGGYNANLLKCLEAESEGKDFVVLPIGKKQLNMYRERKLIVLQKHSERLLIYLWQTVLKLPIFYVKSSKKESLDILNCVIQLLYLCCPSSRRYHPYYL